MQSPDEPQSDELTTLPDDIHVLLAALQKVTRRDSKVLRLSQCLIALFLVNLGLAFLEGYLRIEYPFWQKVLINGLGLSIGAPMLVLISRSKIKHIIEKLSKLEDVRAVGPLSEQLQFRKIYTKEHEKMIGVALVPLLLRVKASDAHLLNKEQRWLLYQTLRGKDAVLITALLRALEQIGDSDALPYVDELCQGRHLAARRKDVRDAARACRPFLRERIEQARVGGELLRAAEATIPPDTLLRATMPTPETAPHELLRIAPRE